MKMADINPIAALADLIAKQLSNREIKTGDLQAILDEMGRDAWAELSHNLVTQTSLSNAQGVKNLRALLKGKDISRTHYRCVFTAHPVFALTSTAAQALCANATNLGLGKPALPMPDHAFATRPSVSLVQEHDEAMTALTNARSAICEINRHILHHLQQSAPESWRDLLPQMMGVSTWVGYDLDGRTDITWSQSIVLRLSEKITALQRYHDALSAIALPEMAAICQALETEITACETDKQGFAHLSDHKDDFAQIANQLTHRDKKLTSPFALASHLHQIAKECDSAKIATELMVIAADIKTHGFGMGEMHLRINAVQLRNAMRSIDGKATSSSDGITSNRQLLERLANRIETEAPWDINFSTLDREAATARRQLMLAAQILKHIDCDMPIRLLIAECEKPITYMSALYLAHKLGIADKLDISPLFETTFGLEHGVPMMSQLLSYQPVQTYLLQRGRLAIQAGFSDAGRFMGQIAANLAIERLQIKLASLCQSVFGKRVELLMFNTHGESLGRGGARPSIKDRQHFIYTPFARNHAAEIGCLVHHQSSFQGGDGYRLFGTKELAYATISSLFEVEMSPAPAEWQTDPFYTQSDFSLDLFLSLKNWHEGLFFDSQYAMLLDVFGANLLPKTGSRPTKRKLQAGATRSDPSKMRAIPHNAILQQLGFLAVVISGMGTAAHTDLERFVEMHQASPRLRQCLSHCLQAKQHGSLNTMLAYGRLLDNGFWIDKAYHGSQPSNQRAFRLLGKYLKNRQSALAIRQTVWKLRDDLIDLYRLSGALGTTSARTTGPDRADLDLLHAIRIALIMDSIVRVFQVPRFAESNRFSQSDLYEAAITLDFDLVAQIVAAEFPSDDDTKTDGSFHEPDSYSQQAHLNYADTVQVIRQPLADNKALILQITQLVSAKYNAHG